MRSDRDRDDRHDRDRVTDDTTLTRRLIASICAQEGGGKTTWMLTAPKPIELFSIDQNTQEIVEKEGYARDTDAVRVHTVDFPAVAFGDKDDIKVEATEIWERQFIEPIKEILRTIRTDLKRGRRLSVGTIAIDTATELRDLQLLKWYGKTTQILKELYTGPNAEFKGLYNSLGRSGVNVVLTHRLKDVYVDKEVRKVIGRGRSEKETVSEKVPGEYQRDGWNKTAFYVNVEAFLFHDPARHERLASQFGMRITRCTARPSVIGDEHWGRERQDDDTRVRRASFPYLATQVYPKTQLSDWE